ncbi:hypothetical protein QQZ08_006862 [Neonectria magnoliae]|uniref:LITAF domain-containing protein n=1 Tax=Neonectria magnoliae TaxID=2732573 RepID=A0ABR1HZL5_9HYPO
MSLPSPPSQPASHMAVSPPLYMSTPVPPPVDEKIVHQRPVAADEGLEDARPIDDDNLPEVVPEGRYEPAKKPIELANVAPMPPAGYQNGNGNGGYTQQQQQQQQQQVPPQQPPRPTFQQQNMSGGYHGQSSMTIPATVTPLHLLDKQSDAIDCPFCQQRTLTSVKKSPSWLTHILAVGLFFGTLCGALAPYLCYWGSNVSHYCETCGRKVAYRAFGQKTMKPLGTPGHLREPSQFPVGMAPQAQSGQQV